MNKNVCILIGQLNDACKLKKSYIDVLENKNVKEFLEMFLAKGFISYFKQILKKKKRYIRVFLKIPELDKVVRSDVFRGEDTIYDRKLNFFKKPFRKIKVVSTISRSQYSNVKILKNYLHTHHTLYIISTIKGFLYVEDALKQNVGGKICLKIIL